MLKQPFYCSGKIVSENSPKTVQMFLSRMLDSCWTPAGVSWWTLHPGDSHTSDSQRKLSLLLLQPRPLQLQLRRGSAHCWLTCPQAHEEGWPGQQTQRWAQDMVYRGQVLLRTGPGVHRIVSHWASDVWDKPVPSRLSSVHRQTSDAKGEGAHRPGNRFHGSYCHHGAVPGIPCAQT